MLGLKTSSGTIRVLGLALALVVAVAVLSVVLNSGGRQHPQLTSAFSSAPGTVKSSDGAGHPSLVTRLMADLQAGRKAKAPHQSLDGTAVKLVKAVPHTPVQIAHLSIPAIGLRTPMFEGVYEDALRGGPGHWPGTPAPGQPGNTVISGHRSTETRPFLYLDRLSRGDVITITRGGHRFRYAVDTVTIVPQHGYVRYVLAQPKRPRTSMVTLFACNPLTAHYQRIVVRARALDGGRPG